MMLQVDHLDVGYGAIKALQGVSLSINRGEIVALIGSNGAGKSTLLRAISGLLKPTAGHIVFAPVGDIPGAAKTLDYYQESGRPEDLTRLRADQIVRLGISHVPEGRQIFSDLTVLDNLMLGAYVRRSKAEIHAGLERCYELFPVLAERRKQRSGTLSGGEQQMLAIGRALMARPTLLLLDEPSLGLAPLIVRKIFQIIHEINASGTTVFLVEQNAHMALTLAHRAYVLQSGKIVLSDAAKNLLDNDEVKRAYLGG